jgi:hypothetical protein
MPASARRSSILQRLEQLRLGFPQPLNQRGRIGNFAQPVAVPRCRPEIAEQSGGAH